MAHADIFEKLSKTTKSAAKSSTTASKTQGNIMDQKLIETIKLLGKQIIEIREIIDTQNQAIDTMKNEIISLRKKQMETTGNIDLAMIDQKDLAKQFRILRATVTGEQIANNRMPTNPEEVARKFYKNYETSSLMNTPTTTSNTSQTPAFSATWGSLSPNTPLEKSMQAENVAKEFIFGRIPKLLNLE